LPKKICNYNGCHKIINYTERYCDDHKTESTQRHKIYDEYRRNKKSAEFYHSGEWTVTREVILNKFNQIDIYAYYVKNEIVQANTVHHIVELNDDWNKRLNIDNLIPVTDTSHNEIHEAYKKSKESKVKMQRLLIELRNKWINEFTL